MIALFTTLLAGLSTEHYKALQCALFNSAEAPTSLNELVELCSTLKESWDGRYTQHLPTYKNGVLFFEVDYDTPSGAIGNLKVELIDDHLRVSEQGHYDILRTSSEVLNFLEYFEK